ncbi:barstar family protein [Paracoccus sp. 11-3]|uniref:Barstar family protein n=1 Tax=Paracoccus amoyensis TaxID=2760093 RepID=A0A926GDQ2_9RHOB|nr:barstar family protein [Paracoccus amoyensis]MBC9246616.1 barstar family protein [Paracoccus amoyensis]
MILILDGSRFDDITGFYSEINRVFMANETWRLGESLDALDDMLRGGYGALHDTDTATLHWLHFDKSRHDLGYAATRGWLQAKLNRPGFDRGHIQAQLEALERGEGQTYFDIILHIIAEHPHIRLKAM